MITLLSPAKTLDLSPLKEPLPVTTPDFLDQTAVLIRAVRKLSQKKLQALMGISEALAELNHQRFQDFAVDPEAPGGSDSLLKPAVLTFQGDVYQGLEAGSWKAATLEYAQEHLRILSGLYGLLRPLDLMQAYRLEMGSSLVTRRGKNLYQFWGGRLAEALYQALQGHPQPVLVNLASNEYFKALPKKGLRARVITPVFQETKDGVPKVISFVAKRSRGAMARWIMEHEVEDPETLKDFDFGGYKLIKKDSTEDKLIFRRKFESVAKK